MDTPQHLPPALPAEVVTRFRDLFDRAVAAGEPEAEAMSLATADAAGRPSVRVVLLKQLDADGLVFYTNTLSRKGRQLDENPWAATNLHWKHLDLQVQVRAEGRVEPVTPAEVDAYFRSRPRGSQIGAWASLQSQTLDRRATLEQRIADIEARYDGLPVPRPPHWSGYRLRPWRLEFWFGRPFRLHERDLLELVDGAWHRQLLYP